MNCYWKIFKFPCTAEASYPLQSKIIWFLTNYYFILFWGNLVFRLPNTLRPWWQISTQRWNFPKFFMGMLVIEQYLNGRRYVISYHAYNLLYFYPVNGRFQKSITFIVFPKKVSFWNIAEKVTLKSFLWSFSKSRKS